MSLALLETPKAGFGALRPIKLLTRLNIFSISYIYTFAHIKVEISLHKWKFPFTELTDYFWSIRSDIKQTILAKKNIIFLSTSLTLYSIVTSLKYHVFENIMEKIA